MNNKVHVKKGDTVYVLSGKNRGKKGKILEVIPSKKMVLIEGINNVTKHKKPRSQYEKGGRFEQESPINASKVMLVCNKCKAPTKVGKKILEDGTKARQCKKCDEIIDIINEIKD